MYKRKFAGASCARPLPRACATTTKRLVALLCFAPDPPSGPPLRFVAQARTSRSERGPHEPPRAAAMDATDGAVLMPFVASTQICTRSTAQLAFWIIQHYATSGARCTGMGGLRARGNRVPLTLDRGWETHDGYAVRLAPTEGPQVLRRSRKHQRSKTAVAGVRPVRDPCPTIVRFAVVHRSCPTGPCSRSRSLIVEGSAVKNKKNRGKESA